jgi:hypothetical protein
VRSIANSAASGAVTSTLNNRQKKLDEWLPTHPNRSSSRCRSSALSTSSMSTPRRQYFLPWRTDFAAPWRFGILLSNKLWWN